MPKKSQSTEVAVQDKNKSLEKASAVRFFDSVDVDRLHLFMTEPAHLDPATGKSKYDDYLRSFADPAYNRLSHFTRMRKFGISVSELHQIYLDGQRHIGLLNLANRLPQVIDDTAADAESRLANCPRCDGETTVESTRGKQKIMRTCPECEGEGKVKVAGDKHARDLVFESAKLIKQSGPLVAIQNNVQTNVSSGLDSRLEDLMKLTQSITVGAKEVREERDVK